MEAEIMSIFFEVNVCWAGRNVRMLQRGYRSGGGMLWFVKF